MRRLLAISIAVLGWAAFAQCASASLVVDAQFPVVQPNTNTYTFGGSYPNGSQVFPGQTCTILNTGKLMRVDFLAFRRQGIATDLSVFLSICPTDATGKPMPWPQSELLRISVPRQNTPVEEGVMSFDLSSVGGLNVTRGQVIALCLGGTGAWSPGVGYTVNGITGWTPLDGTDQFVQYDPYAGGKLWSRYSDGTWHRDDYTDLYFRTYVDTVPEPSCLLALFSGLGVVALRRLSKR